MHMRLNAETMHEAAQLLVGAHDFRSFETDWPNKATSVRTVMRISVARRALWELWTPGIPIAAGRPGFDRPHLPADDLPMVCLEITADGFLYNMVRSIVGTLVNVGRDKWTAADVQRILKAQERSLAGSTAPACGLYLVDVGYE